MKAFFCALVSAFLLSHAAYSQGRLAEFNQAKQLLNKGSYDQAMHLLKPYMDADDYGEVANYATYYFAKAAYHSGQYKLSESSLQPILQKKQWKYQDDARYLSALNNFSLQNISGALNTISQLEDEALLEQAYRASYDFLRDVSTSVLIVNLPEHQENEGLVLALKSQLAKRTVLSAGEQKVFDQIKDLDFSTEGDKKFERKSNQVLDIAVLLPFNYNGGSGVRRLDGNNFVFDLYKGIKMAAEEAKNAGLRVEIRTFDTERKPEVLNKILTDPFMQVADIILGPIYPEESEQVAAFAETRQIPFVNPLSNISLGRASMDYSYLFRPSVSTLSEGILNHNKKLPGKRIAVAYSATSRDELLARQYGEAAARAGFQVVANRKVSARDMRSFFNNLGLESASPGVDQIVIFSDDPNIAAPTFAVVESLSANIPILVMDSWLYFNFASYEMLDVQNFHFVGNNTVSFNKEEVAAFRESFFERFNVYPDLNAHLGYEIIRWISSVINQQRGFDFQDNLNDKGFQEGVLTFGFDFKGSTSNKYVPILNLQEGILEVE